MSGRQFRAWFAATLLSFAVSNRAASSDAREVELERRFTGKVQPFVQEYCIRCHDHEKPKGDFDISPYKSMGSVARDYQHWQMVLERLEAAEMPPKKAEKHPTPEARKEII